MYTIKALKGWMALALAALLMFGGTVMAQDDNPLTGTDWVLVAFGEAEAETPVIAGSQITMRFDDARAGGSAGCNTYGAPYTVNGEAISFGMVVSTRMACMQDGIMAQEAAYLNALAAATTYTLTDEGQLVIRYGEGENLIFVQPDALAGTRWQLLSYGLPDEETPVLEGSKITLSFEQGRVGGNGGCNGYGGEYSVDGEAITFEGVVSTMMACLDDDQMAQETAYFTALQNVTGFSLREDGQTLTLFYGEGEQLVFTRISDLAGTAWELTALGEDALLEGSTITLIFDDEGRIGGTGGCNTYGGSYSVDGETISFGEVFSTMMACMQDGVMTQETTYFEALGAISRYALSDDGEMLMLFSADDEGPALTFRRLTEGL